MAFWSPSRASSAKVLAIGVVLLANAPTAAPVDRFPTSDGARVHHQLAIPTLAACGKFATVDTETLPRRLFTRLGAEPR